MFLKAYLHPLPPQSYKEISLSAEEVNVLSRVQNAFGAGRLSLKMSPFTVAIYEPVHYTGKTLLSKHFCLAFSFELFIFFVLLTGRGHHLLIQLVFGGEKRAI